MKYVVLIRHGESYTNRNGILSSELNKYRLTEEGLEPGNDRYGRMAT